MMLDHPSSSFEISLRQRGARTGPSQRKRIRAPGAFVGVDLVVGWDGPADELVQALRHTGLERLFDLRSVSRGSRTIWRDENFEIPHAETARCGGGPWLVSFDATADAGNRAEAHLPRLLESIALRMTWQQVEKRHDVPLTSLGAVGQLGRRALADRWTGDAA